MTNDGCFLYRVFLSIIRNYRDMFSIPNKNDNELENGANEALKFVPFFHSMSFLLGLEEPV